MTHYTVTSQDVPKEKVSALWEGKTGTWLPSGGLWEEDACALKFRWEGANRLHSSLATLCSDHLGMMIWKEHKKIQTLKKVLMFVFIKKIKLLGTVKIHFTVNNIQDNRPEFNCNSGLLSKAPVASEARWTNEACVTLSLVSSSDTYDWLGCN